MYNPQKSMNTDHNICKNNFLKIFDMFITDMLSFGNYLASDNIKIVFIPL